MTNDNPHKKPRYITLKLIGKPTGEKLQTIREELNQIYPGEYTWSKVAEKCDGITYHGLRKLERGEGEPRRSTVHVLADFYNIPISLIYEDQLGLKLNQQFFLGRKEDMPTPEADYHDDFQLSNEDYNSLEVTEDGYIRTDDISITVSINVYQEPSGIKIMENLIMDRVPFSREDIGTISEFIRQQVKILSDYHLKLARLRESNSTSDDKRISDEN
jgi:hypothetical protein